MVQNGVTGSTAIYVEDEAINNEEGLYNDHLTKVHRRWTELPDTDRQQQWHYECAKAFAREREQHLLTIRKLEQTEQENMLLRKHLTAQGHNASSSEIQDSPLYHQHSLIPTSDKSASYLPKSPSWDFDVLIGKWKSRIQSARSTQYPLPSSTTGEWGSSGPPAGSTSGQTARFEGAGGGGDSGRFTGLQRAAQDAQSGLRGLRDFARGGAQDQDEDVDDAPAEEEEEDDDDRPGATSRQSPVRDTADDESSRGRERAGHPAAVTAARGSDGGPMDTEE